MKLEIEITSKESEKKLRWLRKKGLSINALINLFLEDLKI